LQTFVRDRFLATSNTMTEASSWGQVSRSVDHGPSQTCDSPQDAAEAVLATDLRYSQAPFKNALTGTLSQVIEGSC